MTNENSSLRQRLQFTEDELSVCRDTLSRTEPMVARLQPELSRLQSERDALRVNLVAATTEVESLRPLQAALDALTHELVGANTANGLNVPAAMLQQHEEQQQQQHTHTTQQQQRSSRHGTASLNASLSSTQMDLAGGVSSEHLSLSQKHALWIGLPTVRNVNELLYHNIRAMAADLRTLETLNTDLERKCLLLQRESVFAAQESDLKLSFAQQQQESAQELIATLNQNLDQAQKDVHDSRESVFAIEQIRMTLGSYPGKKSDFFNHAQYISAQRAAEALATQQPQAESAVTPLINRIPNHMMPHMNGTGRSSNSDLLDVSTVLKLSPEKKSSSTSSSSYSGTPSSKQQHPLYPFRDITAASSLNSNAGDGNTAIVANVLEKTLNEMVETVMNKYSVYVKRIECKA